MAEQMVATLFAMMQEADNITEDDNNMEMFKITLKFHDQMTMEFFRVQLSE